MNFITMYLFAYVGGVISGMLVISAVNHLRTMHGTLVVDESDEKITFKLNLNGPAEQLFNCNHVIFEVVHKHISQD